jgi:hypothetical protein
MGLKLGGLPAEGLQIGNAEPADTDREKLLRGERAQGREATGTDVLISGGSRPGSCSIDRKPLSGMPLLPLDRRAAARRRRNCALTLSVLEQERLQALLHLR